jgi:hypothetical protein
MELLVATESQEGPWRTLGTWQFPVEPQRHILEFAPVEARFVKLRLISNFGSDRCVELGEFGVYRLAEETGVLEGIAHRLEASARELKRYREGELRPRGAMSDDG